MKPYKINNWKEWTELCQYWGYDPYQVVEFGLDQGGGNSIDYEYTGEVPEKEE